MRDLPDSPEERLKELQSSKDLRTLVFNKIIDTLIATPSKDETPIAILSEMRALAKLCYIKKEKQSDKPVNLNL